jgi:hypothetical protein
MGLHFTFASFVVYDVASFYLAPAKKRFQGLTEDHEKTHEHVDD